MNANIKALLAACDIKGIHYQTHHANGNLVTIESAAGPALFANWATPVNSHAVSRLCDDKEYAYAALSDYINMPLTHAFLDPALNESYKQYVKINSNNAIASDIESKFNYPFILKRNRGTHGSNVFVIEDRAALSAKLNTIYDKQSKDYDYVALAQQKINIIKEYRAVFFEGELIFAYHKSTTNAHYTGNLSPLHWQGATAIQVTDPAMLSSMETFARQGLTTLGIHYAGVDIAEDDHGQLWCIEVNASPGFEIFIRDCGDDDVIQLYSRLLDTIIP